MNKRNPTVLIVEDETITRYYENEVAENAGFLTLLASDAEEAIKELEGPIEIDAVLTDIRMPGSMDGLELADTVRRRWPDIGLVIASGSIEQAQAQRPENAVLLAKPFGPDQLVSALQSVI